MTAAGLLEAVFRYAGTVVLVGLVGVLVVAAAPLRYLRR